MPNPDCRPKRHGLAGYIAGALSVSRCRGIARREARGTAGQRTDAIERLRDRADALTTRAEALRRLADAEKPLYQSLDEAQKRRFDMAVRFAARQHMAAARAGAAETTSPAIRSSGMGVEQSDIFVILKPKLEWRTAQTEAGLIEAYKQALDQSVPGITQSWAQPIEMRMDDLLQGVMADLAIVIHGTDTATLHDLADQVARVVSGVPGAGDVQRDPH